MKKNISTLLLTLMLETTVFAQAEWVGISKSLPEINIYSLAVSPADPQVVYAGLERNLYATSNGGEAWKRLLALAGAESRIYCIYVDPANPRFIYIGTNDGLRVSEDAGKRWQLLRPGMGLKLNRVLSIASNRRMPEEVWIGTEGGLLLFNPKTRVFKRLESFPETSVRSVLCDDESQGKGIFAATAKGIYESLDSGGHWRRVFVASPGEGESGEEISLQQFGVEEILAQPFLFSNLAADPIQKKIYVGSSAGVIERKTENGVWAVGKGQNIPAKKINAIAWCGRNLYAATDRGAFRWNPASNLFDGVYKGLESPEVHAMAYSPKGGFLLAGTRKGIFRLAAPDALPVLTIPSEAVEKNHENFLDRFKSEPTIRQVQEAAIFYAEVDPNKIQSWRTAASRRAILPTVSLGGKLNRDRSVDIDRGGTTTPDTFIMGPDAKGFDMSLTLNWNLGDLIWNNDQTSIDSRSKLMAELRDDILNEVTHLYYERRRLQVEMLSAPSPEVSTQLEKEMQLEELTAQIDALTGGYLSKSLGALASI